MAYCSTPEGALACCNTRVPAVCLILVACCSHNYDFVIIQWELHTCFLLHFLFIDETSLQTPLGTPMSDSSTDFPYMETQAREPPRSTGTPRKRAVRSRSWDAGSMTHTRLQILSCVRTVRDSIRSQISNSTPSSPVGRSM